MKTVEFSEDQLLNLSEISKELFDDEQDPRSASYIRKLKRPPINWVKIWLSVVLPIMVLAALVFLLKINGFSIIACSIIATMLFCLYVALVLKKAMICVIKIYQRYTPDSLRNKCRFEPSCSEYMILSIEKYGLLKGLRNGIHRLRRCNINGGGIDFP